MGDVVLFTINFPYKGGEAFLETEIWYLAKEFERVFIVPYEKPDEIVIPLPANVEVLPFEFFAPVSVKKTILRYGRSLAKWWLLEIWKSPHRARYFSEFQWNLNRMLGILDCADRLFHQYGQMLRNAKLYAYWFDDWSTILSVLQRKRRISGFVSRVHLFDFEEEFNGRGYLPFRYTEILTPQRIYPISEYAFNYVAKRWPKVQGKLELSRLGVNDRGMAPVPGVSDTPVVVTCSALSWYKRPLFLMEVMASHPHPVVWHHFGDGAMKELFLQKAADLPDHVQFHFHGRVANAEVLHFYQKTPVNVLVNLSEFEGIPVSLMEAISFGIPITGCNVCGVPEVVTGETGLLFGKDELAHSVARKLAEFMETKSRSTEFREGVRSFWSRRFDAEKNYTAFAENLAGKKNNPQKN